MFYLFYTIESFLEVCFSAVRLNIWWYYFLWMFECLVEILSNGLCTIYFTGITSVYQSNLEFCVLQRKKPLEYLQVTWATNTRLTLHVENLLMHAIRFMFMLNDVFENDEDGKKINWAILSCSLPSNALPPSMSRIAWLHSDNHVNSYLKHWI